MPGGPDGVMSTGIVVLRPGCTMIGLTSIGPPSADCQRSPVTDVTAGSKALVTAVSVVVTGSRSAPVAPNAPATVGARSHKPAETGLPVTVALTLDPTPETTSGSPLGAARSNWIGVAPVVVAVPVIDVVSLGTM